MIDGDNEMKNDEKSIEVEKKIREKVCSKGNSIG
jgi:hypothetical protein